MINNIFSILGGLSVFVYGMTLMSEGLHQAAGERLRFILSLFSRNRLVAVMAGAIVTCVIQSSSASTVMIIGFVNAGLLALSQAIGMIFGANIGTTITAQLVALKISWLVMPMLFFGGVLLFVKSNAIACWGKAFLGFGFLFLGLEFISTQLKALSQHAFFTDTIGYFNCAPVNGWMPVGAVLGAIVIGMLATLVMQSSSAFTGIIIVMGANGLLDLFTATALVLGSNIGTTITALLASLTANRVAKQAALAHTLFNIIGVVLMLVICYIPVGKDETLFFWCIHSLSGNATLERQIANAHTVFNILTAVFLFPLIPQFTRLCERIIPCTTDNLRFTKLDHHLLNTPAIALTQTVTALRTMFNNAFAMVDAAFRIYSGADEKSTAILKNLDERENDIDERQKDIADYLSKLMQKSLKTSQALQIPLLLHCSNDAERIGDHSILIRNIMDRICKENIRFSNAATDEYTSLLSDLEKHAKRVLVLLEKHSAESILEVKQYRHALYTALADSEKKHVKRLVNGQCRPEDGLVFLELLEEMRKILRHLSNITDRVDKFYTIASDKEP